MGAYVHTYTCMVHTCKYVYVFILSSLVFLFLLLLFGRFASFASLCSLRFVASLGCALPLSANFCLLACVHAILTPF